jgi:hypothetical protein
MNESTPATTLTVIRPTFLRLKLLYAAFVGIIFIASLFLAIVMLDNGFSYLLYAENPSDNFIGIIFILVGVMAVAGSLVILLPALVQLRLAINLESHGQKVEGIVVEKYLEKDKEGRHYGHVACVFNQDFLLEQNIVQSKYQRLKEGDKIMVRCLPRNPAIARLEDMHV